MLVLTRKLQQQIKIGDGITVTILRVKGQTVRVGIEAPRDMRVVRGDLKPKSDAALTESDAATELILDDVPEVEELAFVVTGDDFDVENGAADVELVSAELTVDLPAKSVAADSAHSPSHSPSMARPPRKANPGQKSAGQPTTAPRLPQRKRFNRSSNPPLRVAMQSLSTTLAK